jgi:hypothetical protein
MRASGWVGLLAAAAVAAGIAGCGTGNAPPPAAGSSGGAGGSTTARSASNSLSPSPAGPGATASARPPGGPVPAGFAATSVTWVSPQEAFVLGTAPCAHAPCTSIVRTLDRGASWVGLPAPVVPVGEPSIGSAPVVWGIRFATPEIGFVFGDGLWQTTDGGEQWTQDSTVPSGSILSLAIVAGQVLIVTAQCTADGGCAAKGALARRPLTGGGWTPVVRPAVTSLIDPDDLIDTQAGVAAVVVGFDVFVSHDGGLTFTLHPVPCAPTSGPPSVAVTSATGLVALCTGEGYTGHTIKQTFVSDDDGASWARAGAPSPDGDGGVLAATPAGNVVIATASAASWLFYSPDGAQTWRTVNEQYDGGAGWADLGFTTDTDGVVIHGPAVNDANTQQRPGQLFLTSDGGATWTKVTF